MTMQIHCSSSSLHSLIPASSVAVAGSNDFCSILMATFYFPSVFLHSLIRILLQDIPSLPLNDLFTDLYSVGSWTFMWYFSTTSCFGHGNPRPREPSGFAPMPLTCQLHFKTWSLCATATGLTVYCQAFPTVTCFFKKEACLKKAPEPTSLVAVSQDRTKARLFRRKEDLRVAGWHLNGFWI